MFSTLSSYIWSSASEDQTVPDISVDSTGEAEDEWILVDFVRDKANAKSDEIGGVASKQETAAASAPRSVDILEESWYVTPPSCFNASQGDSFSLQTNPLEDLLIEHPSMSVYGGPIEPWLAVEESHSEESLVDETSSETAIEPRTHSHHRTVRTVDKAQEHSRRVQKNVLEQTKKNYRKKKLQKQNQTHVHKTRSRRKQKKMDRRDSKHSTVYSNRGC